jgi:hypothetical protein
VHRRARPCIAFRAKGGSFSSHLCPPLPLLHGRPPTYAGGMNTIHLTDEELKIARHGMTAYLRSFGHEEAETVVLIRAVLARLAAAQPEPDPSAAHPESDPSAAVG